MITKLVENIETGELEVLQIEGTFQEELEELINRYSMENQSDTPDYILAEYLVSCLNTWAYITRQRDKWFGYKPFGYGEDDGRDSMGGEVPPTHG